VFSVRYELNTAIYNVDYKVATTRT